MANVGWRSSSATPHFDPAIHCVILLQRLLRSVSGYPYDLMITSSIIRAAHAFVACVASVMDPLKSFSPCRAPSVAKSRPLSLDSSQRWKDCKNCSPSSTACKQITATVKWFACLTYLTSYVLRLTSCKSSYKIWLLRDLRQSLNLSRWLEHLAITLMFLMFLKLWRGHGSTWPNLSIKYAFRNGIYL